MGKMRKKEEEEEQAAEALPNDLLREILLRVPYRSLCRLKCVSPAWLALCSDPAVRRRSTQTLSGFFGDSPNGTTRFINLSGRGWPLVDPSLPFLRGRGYHRVTLLGCYGGILLCHGMRAWRAEYIVCNPTTEEIWAALPVPRSHKPPEPYVHGRTISLCFNPAVPSRFAMFVIIDDGHDITTIEVYSSGAGEWTSVSSGWGHQMRIGSPSRQIFWDEGRSCESGYFFLDGTLHFIAYYDSGDDTFDSEGSTINLIVTVDTDGSTWRTIRQPPKVKFTFIGHSQGRLHGMEIDHDNGCQLSVWVLENYASGQWTLKHTANILELLGRPCLSPYYTSVAIHPEHNLIFLDGWVESKQALMSYDMDTQKLQVICSLENYPMENLRPHVPCFVEWPPSDAH